MKSVVRKLLHDSPAQKDAFSGGGHDRTARSLARTILELDERDAVIGLDGKWGSGKSSVIRMAADHLAQQSPEKQFHVITFDLWANQSVPFRRGFLERTLEWAQGEKAFGKHKNFLDEQLEKIGGKIKETRTKSHFEFNWLGLVFVLAVPLLPLIYAWLSPFAIKPTPLTSCTPDCAPLTVVGNWIKIHGTDLALGTAIALYCLVGLRFAGLWWETGSFKDSLSKLGSLIERKGEENQKNELIRDVDPTNYEFTKTFRAVLQRLQSKKDRIVFVFDNIDRLETANIPSAWADIIAVLQRSDRSTYDRVLTAVVPYDKATIESVIRGQVPKQISNSANENKDDPDDLFRKSFDVILNVSQPVISDTRQFFLDRLKKSVSDQCDEDESERVARIFDLSVRDSGQPPTPRRVLSFINEVTTRWVEWDGEIPIDSVAVYVANRDFVEEERSAAKIAAVTSGLYRTRVRATARDLEAHIAMLTFSAPKDLALEVMLARPIERALVQSTPDQIRSLTASPSFPIILAQVLENLSGDIAGRSAAEYDRALGNLFSLAGEGLNIRDSMRLLASARGSVPAPGLGDMDAYPHIMRLPLAVAEEEIGQAVADLVNWLSSNMPKVSERTAKQGGLWILAIGNVRSAVIEAADQGRWDQIQGSISIPSGANFAYGVATECDEAAIRFRDLNYKLVIKSLQERIREKIADNDEYLQWVLSEVLPIASKESIAEFVNDSIDYIGSHDPASVVGGEEEEVGFALDVFTTIAAAHGPERMAEVLKAAIQNGAVVAYLYKLSNLLDGEPWSETFARALVLLLSSIRHGKLVINTPGQHPTFGDITTSVDWFSALLDGSLESQQIQALEDAARHFRIDYVFVALAGDDDCKRSAYQQLGVSLITNGPTRRLAGKDFVTRFERLGALFDNLDPLLSYGRKIDDADGWSNVEPLELPSFLVGAVSSGEADAWPRLMAKLDDAIVNRTSSDWTKDFAEGEHVVELAQVRTRLRNPRIPIDRIKEPLITHVLNVISGSDAAVGFVDTLCDGLPTGSSRSVPGAVIERLGQAAVKPGGLSKLMRDAPELMSKLPLAKQPDVSFAKILLPTLESLDRNNAQYIVNNADQFTRVVKELGDDAANTLIETLGNIQPPADESVDLGTIAEALGVEIPTKSDASDDSEPKDQ